MHRVSTADSAVQVYISAADLEVHLDMYDQSYASSKGIFGVVADCFKGLHALRIMGREGSAGYDDAPPADHACQQGPLVAMFSAALDQNPVLLQQ